MAKTRQSWVWSLSRFGAVVLLVLFLKITSPHAVGTAARTTSQSQSPRRSLLQSSHSAELSRDTSDSLVDVGSESSLQNAHPQKTNEDSYNGSSLAEDTTVDAPCSGVWEHDGYPDMCSFVKARPSCQSGTFIEYLQLHFCYFKHAQLLSYFVLALWLVMLFYTLGNTAADYFCPRYVDSLS